MSVSGNLFFLPSSRPFLSSLSLPAPVTKQKCDVDDESIRVLSGMFPQKEEEGKGILLRRERESTITWRDMHCKSIS